MDFPCKGQTPVVATVLLIGLTVASTATVYQLSKGTVEKSKKKAPELQLNQITVERCWQESGKTRVMLRNTADRAMDVSNLDVLIEGNVESDFNLDSKTVGPGENFRVSIDRTDIGSETRIKFAAAGNELTYRCLGLQQVAAPEGNLDPAADFLYTSSGLTVDTDASLSRDPDGKVTGYEWRWKSGGSFSDTGETQSHTYGSGGSYDVTLRVTDNDGVTDTVTREVSVSVNAPSASFTTTVSGCDVEVDGSGSSDNDEAGASIEFWRWDRNIDGSYDKTQSDPTATLSYSSNGDKTIKLQVKDDEGQTGSTTNTVSLTSCGTSGAGPVTTAVSEQGDSIPQLQFGTSGSRSILPTNAYDTSLPAGTICLGSGCSPSRGSCTDVDTNDCKIDVEVEEVSGTLTTSMITYPSGTPLCIGNNCGEASGDSNAAPNGDLGEEATKMDGPLFVDYVNTTTSSGALCVGPNC